MSNLSGVLAFASLAWRPSAILPSLVVRDISRLDWRKLRAAGYTGVVLDKDNCLTRPLSDELVPTLRPSWDSLMDTFGPRNILLVSNSAGTRDDPALIQAEAVSRSLGVNVLIHSDKKPAARCARDAAAFLSSPDATTAFVVSPTPSDPFPPPRHHEAKLLVVGDRLTTDVILAHRMNRYVPTSSVLTTAIWGAERPATRLLRSLEWGVYRLVARVRGHRPDFILEACLAREEAPPRSSRPTGAGALLSSGFRRPELLENLRRLKYVTL